MRSSDRGWARRLAPLAPIVALGLALGGCTVEDPVVSEIGTTQLLLVDADLATQTVTTDPGEHTFQVSEWVVERAVLTLDGVPIDLTFGGGCGFVDTAPSSSVGTGKCATGVVVDSGSAARPAALELTFTMRVRRAEPLDLAIGQDYDGDGVPNETDNCPIIDNPEQRDSTGEGFGDSCAVRQLTGGVDRDSDRDRASDVTDNCPHIANSDQKDTTGIGTTGIPDGIGDACTEQIAEVRVAGAATIELALGPEELVQPLFRPTFLTVDLRSASSLDCDWDAATCELDPTQIRFCVLLSRFGAGCSAS